MKLLLIALTLVASTTLFAADCETNTYGLTKESLVVAYDWADKVYDTRTGHAVDGEYFFNYLIDSSCVKVDITNRGDISCVNENGSKVAIGYVGQELLGEYSGFTFYRAVVSDNVVVITKKVNGICTSGIKVK